MKFENIVKQMNKNIEQYQQNYQAQKEQRFNEFYQRCIEEDREIDSKFAGPLENHHDKIVEFVNMGMTREDIAVETGITFSRLGKYMSEHNIKVIGRKKRMNVTY